VTVATPQAARVETPEPRPRRPVLAAVAVGAAVALLTAVLAFGLTRDPGGPPSSPLIGKRAPDFELPLLDGGGVVRLSDLRGQVVVVNFWASWCAPCRDEHPHLQNAWTRYRDQGAVILGVMYQDSAEGARAYLEELGGDWPILQDPGARAAIDYGVFGVPETVFIGPDGIVAHKVIGEVDYLQLSRWITRLSGAAG
jgi:cytochrome c biogenesis protein CcmG, thiol:disulfide interchange protein DsbE